MSTCHVCGGEFEERVVTLSLPSRRGWISIDDAPVIECDQCGERAYSAEVSRVVERLQTQDVPTDETRSVPVYNYARVSQPEAANA
jgi:YgiT-type zinc finger domain-containing protein